jgi:radical SAM protein with 4Fe4S-binding SPASM domain
LGRGADVGWDKVSKDGMRKYRLKWGELVKKHKGFMLLSQPRVIREMQRGINCGHGHRSWVIGPSGDVRPCVMMPEGLISLGNILREEIENIASNPFLGNLFSVKPPGSYSTCDFCKYNVFCPFCLYRAICAGQENDECELWRDPMLAAHVNTSYLGRYSCSMAYTMFQR